ncbi:hypothetical protein TrVE_jg6204 [Triparma verrucosa]|uniref:Glutamine--fructose-6-phosphate aminotransferase [isomerizing] n=1 Tax=Triparma verrucosa TaxID=1606542 RepID=A0A9W7BEG2_9STRA|nr:hypothetical protein TrVE_jg6204 [Triparma verrucosa]
MIGARLVTRQSINWTRRSALSSKFHYSTTKQVTSQVLPAAATFLPAIATASSKESSDPGRSLLALGLFLLASPLLLSPQRSTQPTECCGIVGVVAKPQKRSTGFTARDFLIEGLTVLKNRGYDSAGVATVGDINGKGDSPGIVVTKYASVGDNADGVELVSSRSRARALSDIPSDRQHVTGIAHTRWATHGGKTDLNAHPHLDSSGKIALVHNGTINNANSLRAELEALGHEFSSETDTEVIAKLIGHIRDTKKITVKEATERALQRCDGSWGLAVMCEDSPDEIIVACNGSPLVIGISDTATYIASETSAFNRYTKEFISMKDGEIGIVHADGRELDLSRSQVAPDQEVVLSPAPYPHWTIKETLEQPEAIARALSYGGRLTENWVKLGGLDADYRRLSQIKHMTLSACGTSLNAALYGVKLMKHLKSFDGAVQALDAAETSTKDFISTTGHPEQSGVIVVSQSGETKDVMRVVNSAVNEGFTTLSVVNAVGSLIARTTKLGVYLNAGRENAVASTKAFSTQVTVLSLLAIWFRQTRDIAEGKLHNSEATKNLHDSLMRLPMSFGMSLKLRDQMKSIAKTLVDKHSLFVLGKGFAEPVAYEGALKIKETSYLHAEGYSGGALKHGPFALIEDKNGKFGATPIILIILDDEHKHHMRTAAEEVKARGAQVIIITDKAELAQGLTSPENTVVIPSNGPLTALIATCPLQLLAYELSILKGINPDCPRNLAKAVTVD